MTATESVRECDVVVLGVGPGGEYAARKLAEAGLDVVGVDRGLVGGECPFWGCTPSKLMVRPSDLVAEVHRADRLAGDARIRPDWSLVAARIREANHDWSDHQHVEPLEHAGVRIVRGHGRLDGPGTVRVELDGATTVLRTTRGVLVNTGTEPMRPPIDGLADTPYWTNREAMKVTEVPDRLVVLGGGPNGLELATVFARFGARVTLLEAADRVAAQEEPEAGELLARILRDEGVDVRAGAEVERVDHDGEFHLRVGGEVLDADQLLVVTGRRNNLTDIGLETVGLDPEAETIDVDGHLRAGERLWAVGDITGKGAFTHVSRYQAAGAVADILGHDGPPADYGAVSRVVFSDPELAAVGLTEQQARDAGLSVRVGLAQVEKSARGWLHGPGTTGLVKVVEDADRGVLVGATVVAPYGGEVVGMLVTAVHGEVPVSRLRTMHYAYPTFHRTIEAALKRLA
ncbi:dihydrolipoyl dehydrogenase family protein [Nocardioides halotolerans]|uniref:dihydrolipoyl dehydrogenase family protein n=1 Tax=Nocardioides halotolerans TaxID=433660 RepID=UPI0003F4B7A8|nr:NAD(P)/FAD-dependent oxidoreductase [Nocardioides halotolerans]